MFYKKIISIIILLFLTNCTISSLPVNKDKHVIINAYSNKGFALVYSNDLFEKKIINKKILERSLLIFQRNLKANTQVKITNILNNKSIIGTVGKDSIYPSFNNAVLSIRIADELNLNINEPYVEILQIQDESIFVAKKAKTYEEEKIVATKVPVNSIIINDLNKKKTNYQKKNNNKFSYIIKIADFYFKDTALIMVDRIKSKSSFKNPNIEKISDKKYRVYLGPFDNISSLQKSYNDISILNFENIEFIKK